MSSSQVNFKHALDKHLDRKIWANSVDPDQTLQNMAADQCLPCLALI